MSSNAIRKYPIGIQDFEDLITSGFCYVDKTEIIYNLIQGRAVFLSRPRRFGKSLLVSTLKAYFEGKKGLFAGLKMEQLEKEWVKHPVLNLSFAGNKTKTKEGLLETIDAILFEYEEIYGVNVRANSPAIRLSNLIKNAYNQTGQSVVILIDEYDAPLLETINDDEILAEMRYIIRNLFSPLKDSGKYIRFLFITGITKYSQLNIFSELNHLVNISMLPQFSAICGITEEELFFNFKEDIELLAYANDATFSEISDKLKSMYDGYHFSHSSPDIYNPFSILHALCFHEIKSYWFESATPTFLLELLLEKNINVADLESLMLDDSSFNAPITDELTVIPTLYHSGYLTIKDYNKPLNAYTIGFPNEEVRIGLIKSLVPRVFPHIDDDADLSIFKFILDLQSGDIDMFLTRLRSLFADVPYVLNNKTEKHYQTMFYIFVRFLGQYAQVEMPTAIGRVDLLVRISGYVYLFEFKFNGTAKEALDQINSKEYAIKYEAGTDKVIKVGVNFDEKTRTITDWLIE